VTPFHNALGGFDLDPIELPEGGIADPITGRLANNKAPRMKRARCIFAITLVAGTNQSRFQGD